MKPNKKTHKSRKEIFESFEKPNALRISDRRYEVSEWQKVSVSIDHHIEFDAHYYSVPYTLVKHRLDVRATRRIVAVFQKDKRVALHQRQYSAYQYSTLPEHRPPSHQKFLEWTPERILNWGQEMGDSVHDLIQKVIHSRRYPEQAYRACLGIIRLEKKFSRERLNNACKRALAYQVLSYRGVKNILLKKLDIEDTTDISSSCAISHENIRGANYYQTAHRSSHGSR